MRQATEEDTRLISTPLSWPAWPVLPLKRNDDQVFGIECGFIFSGDTDLTVYIHSMFGIDELGGTTWAEKLSLIEDKKKYATVSELLDDGWVVD
ncbi:hypothetical protein LCGC14_1952750 [marine sediment metagenome]|uniref:Uncharacterized protein n=1 Tax=marine sediment metagenome TaxID=412755 RepID=A0A0F9HVC5_9ZZZZ